MARTKPTAEETALRAELVREARRLVPLGLTQGTSGNLSVRCGARMLITPSAIPYEDLTPELICAMPLDDPEGSWEGPRKPSSEWRFHRDILRARPDVNAVVHAHSPFATVLSIARRDIPAVHYMIAGFGGPTIRCGGYALFGTQALSDRVLEAMEGRNGCLMANHGMIAAGPSLARAMWLAVELETLAMQHFRVLQIGGGAVLTDAEVAEAAAMFAGYGAAAPQAEASRPSTAPASSRRRRMA